MPLVEGTKLSSTFHAVAAGATTVMAAVAGHKTGIVDPMIAGVMGLATYLGASTAGDAIGRKIKKHFYQEENLP